MRKAIIVGVSAALGVAFLAPRGANACGRGGGYGYPGALVYVLGPLALGLAAADVALTLWDTGSMVSGHRNSTGYAAGELIVAAPQVVLGLAALSSSGGSSGYYAGYTLWMAALTWHGIWTLWLHAGEMPAPATPAVDDRATPALSAKVEIGPTYVPLGPLAHPGFGLTARF
jgi:hypothetical protein